MKMLSVIVHLQKKKSLEKTEKQRNGRQNDRQLCPYEQQREDNIKEKENGMKNWFL